MTEEYCLGVDWANGSWLGIVFEDRQYTQTAREETIGRLYDRYEDSLKRMFGDIPIGLFERGDREGREDELQRRCDAAARQVIGPRYRSVFNPPARDALEARASGKPYSRVAPIHEEVTGKGLQQQAFNIGGAVYEVDRFLREHPRLADDTEPPFIVESHPEVCFRALAGEDITHAKQTAVGVGERVQALEGFLGHPRDVFFEVCEDLTTLGEGDHDVDIDVDDVLDALVLAVAASAPDDELHRLPGDGPDTDSCGLPMQMVYRADEPLLES